MLLKDLGILLLVGWCLCTSHAFGQDTLIKSVVLKEVNVCNEESEPSNQSFNFYRSSKISSTEEILARIEGVNLVRRGAFAAEPQLRIFNTNQVKVTIGGMHMYGACTDKMDPISSYIEPNNLHALEIAQGAADATLGSTVGGSIQFKLKEATFNKNNKPNSAFYTQFNANPKAMLTGFNTNVNNNKLAMRITGTYRTANNYFDGVGNQILYSKYNKWNTSLSLGYKVKQHEVIADVILDKGFDIGYPALLMDVSSAFAQIYSLAHRMQLAKLKNALVESKVYYNTIFHQMDDTQRPETVIHMDMPGWSNTKGFYTNWQWLGKTQFLNARLDGHKVYTRADMTMYPTNSKPMYMATLPGNNLGNLGFAIKYNRNFKKGYLIETSLRVDHFNLLSKDSIGAMQWEAFNVNIYTPLRNVVHTEAIYFERKYRLFKHGILLSRGERLPTANERIGFYLYNAFDGYDYLGNYNLKTERSFQVEYKWTLKYKRVGFGVNLFAQQINQWIYSYIIPNYSPMTIGANGVKTYYNIDYARLIGFECNYQFKINDHWLFNGNVRNTKATLSNGKHMAQVPPLKTVNAIRYQIKTLQIQMEHLFALAQNRINADYGEISTPSWQIFNMRFSYSKKIKKAVWQVNLAFDNLLDSLYREHLNWGNIPQPGRNVAIGLNVYF